MAVHSWSLIELDDDGSTIRTRSLSTAGVLLSQHVPNEFADQNGIVTESVTVLFEDYGGSTAREISQEVREYITQAERYHTEGKGARVYLLMSLLDEATTWRSPLVGGSIEWGVDALRAYSSGTMESTIILQRLNWFEQHDAETLLGTNESMTNNGASIVSLSDPGGTLPAPVRVELTNQGGSTDARNIYMSINSDAGPGTIDLTLEPTHTPAQWSTARTYGDGLTIVPGGPPYDIDGRHQTKVFSEAELAALRGQDYFILVGLSSMTGTWHIRASVYYNGVYYLARTDGVYVTAAGIIVLGPVAIPPSGTGANQGLISLALNVRTPTDAQSNAGSYVIKWTQLMPASTFRRLYQTGFSIINDDKWVDDGANNRAYVYDYSAGYNIPTIEASGPPLEVIPGKTSELRVVFDERTGGLTSTHPFEARVYCRPRRLTL